MKSLGVGGPREEKMRSRSPETFLRRARLASRVALHSHAILRLHDVSAQRGTSRSHLSCLFPACFVS